MGCAPWSWGHLGTLARGQEGAILERGRVRTGFLLATTSSTPGPNCRHTSRQGTVVESPLCSTINVDGSDVALVQLRCLSSTERLEHHLPCVCNSAKLEPQQSHSQLAKCRSSVSGSAYQSPTHRPDRRDGAHSRVAVGLSNPWDTVSGNVRRIGSSKQEGQSRAEGPRLIPSVYVLGDVVEVTATP